MKPVTLIGLILCLGFNARAERREIDIAVAQGISFPSVGGNITFSHGLVFQNPVGAAQQDGARFTIDGYQGPGATFVGAEIGYGKGNWGLAAGAGKDTKCTSCDTSTAGTVAVVVGPVGIGARFQNDFSGLGLLIGASGKHRLGIVGVTGTGDTANYGLGYAYNGGNFVISIDASKHQSNPKVNTDDIIYATGGVAFAVDIVQLSIDYDTQLNQPENYTTTDTKNLWFGIGFGSGSWRLNIYSDYIGDTAAAFTSYF